MTKFLFVRHGEPDYSSVAEWAHIPMGKNFAGLSENGKQQIRNSCELLAKYDVDIIVSSPFTRTMQGAAIMSKQLNAGVEVERDLYEWQADLTYSITDDKKLLMLCQEHDHMNGVYPSDETKMWESTEMVRDRVLACLKKYCKFKCVVISGHAMMMQAVLGITTPIDHGQILTFEM